MLKISWVQKTLLKKTLQDSGTTAKTQTKKYILYTLD
jgi:hypothetical protein